MIDPNEARHDPRVLGSLFHLALDQMIAGAYSEAEGLLVGFAERVARATDSSQFGNLPSRPAASIVVVSYKSTGGVEPAIAAIAHQARDENCEVILVDNGNEDLERIGRQYLDGARIVKPPFQAGASLGRTLGANLAEAPYLIFIDDDGLIEPGFVSGLVSAARETGAVSVRGRIEILTAGGFKPPHYDLGTQRCPAFAATEGASIWQRGIYLQSGGFHPLLYGHEGIDLCARLYCSHGPLGFYYEPSAVLRHDYADDPAGRAVKKMRYDSNAGFVEHRSPSVWKIQSLIDAISTDGRSSGKGL